MAFQTQSGSFKWCKRLSTARVDLSLPYSLIFSAEDVKRETEEPNRIEFGGEVKPQALRMMGICEAVFEDGLQACVWRAEENTSEEPVTKYKISF